MFAVLSGRECQQDVQNVWHHLRSLCWRYSTLPPSFDTGHQCITLKGQYPVSCGFLYTGYWFGCQRCPLFRCLELQELILCRARELRSLFTQCRKPHFFGRERNNQLCWGLRFLTGLGIKGLVRDMRRRRNLPRTYTKTIQQVDCILLGGVGTGLHL